MAPAARRIKDGGRAVSSARSTRSCRKRWSRPPCWLRRR
jgi:hypothetical protein